MLKKHFELTFIVIRSVVEKVMDYLKFIAHYMHLDILQRVVLYIR